VIPVLIAPAYNRIDLLWRMLQSVDTVVGRTLIVDNGRNMTSVNAAAADIEFPHLNSTIWAPPFKSIGYGGAINFGITQTAEEPWWLWVSNDVRFEAGFLEREVVPVMEDRKAGDVATVLTGGFTWAAINAAAVQLVGLVDDWSFFPIYFDDNDYHYRAHLAGIEWVEMGPGWSHGDGTHPGSLTINSDPKAQKANHNSFEQNKAAYVAKWGGMPGQEVFTSPWDSGWPVWVTRPDVAGRATRQW